MTQNSTPTLPPSRPFTLVQPLEDGNTTHTTATVKPLTAAKAAELDLPALENITLEQQEALVVASTGIDANVLQFITKMDFNTLFEAAYDYYSLTSYDLAGMTIDAKSRKLILMFKEGEPQIEFDFPTLLVSKNAAKVKGDVARAMFIISQITDLDEEDIKELAQPDYLAMVEMTSDFLLGMADSFL
ncbi:hypothetical protein L1D52_24050 [Vibrio brasiliensis]|uniref:hypothetical protein n=1 Tax=Vibrio brasiliensis TaxID=170652 RepID=UPI001EFDB9DF|nr:hypothetical protein [Vibrio brasiliensis]MCG9785385.1 hypothetical protein [Vibrio brasiliensis]